VITRANIQVSFESCESRRSSADFPAALQCPGRRIRSGTSAPDIAGTIWNARPAKSPDAGQAFFAFFAQLIETGATNKAIFDALSGASAEVQTACKAVSVELGSALAELLAAAQTANTVRADVTADDLNALVIGALAAQTAVAPSGSPKRLIQVTCDGLRPAR
jgi:hypothetical protein